MSNNKIVLHPAPPSNRRQPLLQIQSSKKSSAVTLVGEVVGGTTAECVAVCCCCPCGVFNFLVLAFYKVPFGLCRRMLRKRRRQKMIKDGLLPPKRIHCSCGCCELNGSRIYPMCATDASDVKRLYAVEPDKDAVALEKEMWDWFYSAGFWRSNSRRESSQQTCPDVNVGVPTHLL